METIISLIIAIIVFCIVAYGLKWVCTNFGLPQPILWICGALLLIILLYSLYSLPSLILGHYPHHT